MLLLGSFSYVGGVSPAHAQDFGPYENDEHTLMLLHFDGNFTNESDSSADAVPHSAPGGGLTFADAPFDDDLGQVVIMDNDTEGDSSYVTVPDTAALDLTETWTIEGWFNVFTFGEDLGESHRVVPRFIAKPNLSGSGAWYFHNYFVELWGTDLFFSSGYYTGAGPDTWGFPQVDSPNASFRAGTWYHITFIRDDDNKLVIELLHDKNGDLLDFGWSRYNPLTQAPPRANDSPVHMGFGGRGGSWLDGALDEMRISDVVRDVEMPAILDATRLENQSALQTEGYEVNVNALALGNGGDIEEVTLHYNATGDTLSRDQFETEAMSEMGDGEYAASIPNQEAGTSIEYFVTGTRANTDLTGYFPGDAAVTSGGQGDSTYTFSTFQPQAKVLDLAFESGSGTPVDSSTLDLPVEVIGSPSYSTDTPDGSEYSIQFTPSDSSALEIDSQLLASDSVTVEFWFESDSTQSGTWLLTKEDDGAWFQSNYEVKFDGSRIAAGSYFPDGGGTPDNPYIIEEMGFPADTIQSNTWYQARYIVKSDTAHFEINDTEGDVVARQTLAVDGTPINGGGPLTIGTANYPNQSFFSGKIDNVEVYNYALPFEAEQVAAERPPEQPQAVTLRDNYPNPFRQSTSITYALQQTQQVTLAVYDVLGRKVKTLVSRQMPAGTHEIIFDGSGLSSGVYFYHLEAGETSRVRKMTVVR
jgi:hypothetical protein